MVRLTGLMLKSANKWFYIVLHLGHENNNLVLN